MNASKTISVSILAVIVTIAAALPIYRATHHYLVQNYCDTTSEDWNEYQRCLAIDSIGK